MITIDGNYLEGGGQIVRTALALSMITQQPFRCTNIRAGREKPGLKAQHLTGIETFIKFSGARCEGAALGSEDITFYPKPLKSINEPIDIGTAGSITLLLQTLLPACLLSKKKSNFSITGGTDVSWSPSIDYLTNVVLPHFQKYATVDVKLLKRGYYPKGGGEVEVKVKPRFTLSTKELAPPIDLVKRGKLIEIQGVSHSSRDLLDAEVADRQRHAAQFVIAPLKVPTTLRAEYAQTSSTGSGITLWAHYRTPGEVNDVNPVVLGADKLGEKGVRSETIGTETAQRLITDITAEACVDIFLCDQLIPLLALFGGKMKVAGISRHTQTNMYVVQKFLNTLFSIDKEENIISVAEHYTLSKTQKKLLS